MAPKLIFGQKSTFVQIGQSHFFCNFFSLFFHYQCIHRDHTPRRFSIYHFLLCGSVQKMAAKLKFGKNRLFLPMVTYHFFCNFFSLFFRHQCIHRDHTSRRFSIYHFLLCGSRQKWPQSYASTLNSSDIPAP